MPASIWNSRTQNTHQQNHVGRRDLNQTATRDGLGRQDCVEAPRADTLPRAEIMRKCHPACISGAGTSIKPPRGTAQEAGRRRSAMALGSVEKCTPACIFQKFRTKNARPLAFGAPPSAKIAQGFIHLHGARNACGRAYLSILDGFSASKCSKMHAGVHHDPQGQQSELFVSVNFTFKTEVRIPREIILISVI